VKAEDAGSVTQWVKGLKNGDPEAARLLWDRYFHQLVELARVRLRGEQRVSADEEDAALDAFDSFCRGVKRDLFAQLDDRQDLWRILITITVRKASDQVKHARRLKRGAGLVVYEADLAAAALERGDLGQIAGRDPSPELVAMLAEESRKRFDALPGEMLRLTARLRMDGYSQPEIAEQCNCCLTTVERRLRIIRAAWTKDEDEDESG
jgi:DNA-directed RNA polymerase specialized sigma24 family protein